MGVSSSRVQWLYQVVSVVSPNGNSVQYPVRFESPLGFDNTCITYLYLLFHFHNAANASSERKFKKSC